MFPEAILEYYVALGECVHSVATVKGYGLDVIVYEFLDGGKANVFTRNLSTVTMEQQDLQWTHNGNSGLVLVANSINRPMLTTVEIASMADRVVRRELSVGSMIYAKLGMAVVVGVFGNFMLIQYLSDCGHENNMVAIGLDSEWKFADIGLPARYRGQKVRTFVGVVSL